MPELKLPDRLRDMDMIGSVSDASKSVSDVVSDRLSKVDLSNVRTPKLDVKVNTGKARARAVEMIPRRSGPNPVPFLVLGIMGGVLIGIWVATSEMFGAQIRSWVDDIESQIETMMPGMGQRARGVQSNLQQTLSTAGRRAENDYEQTARSAGEDLGSGVRAGTSGATDYGTTNSNTPDYGTVGTASHTATDGDTAAADPYGTGTSGPSY